MLHTKAVQYTLFSRAHGTFSSLDHILGHKASLSKFKKIQVMSSVSSNHTGMTVEINYKEKSGKHTNMWRLNSVLLNNQ